MADFSFNYADSDQAGEELTRATQAVAREIETLHQSVRNVMNQLEGAMATQYESKHREWLAKIEEMRGILQSGNQTLNNIHNGYGGTDTSEHARWESLRVG
ncbi:WXG100 family type VII secretion target [Streptomyces chartreusis]|uniref:WXG100 family type VII secretion target n=1 Tax=Streptomyces chartreusis TaxID=1969 RepID=UPI00381BBDB9